MGINNIIKIVSIGLAMAVISSTSHALTYEGSLTTSPKGTYTYNATLDHKEEVVYEQSAADVTFTLVKMKNNQQKKLKANEVPGKNANGYSKLIVKKIDEKNVSIEVDKQDYSGNQTIPLKYTVRGFFAVGTWSDFISNKLVQIKLTDESKKLSQNPVRAYMSKVIKLIGDKMNPIGNFKGIQMAATDFKFDVPVIQGTKKRLTQDFNINTKFKLY